MVAVIWEAEEVWSGFWHCSTCCVFATLRLLAICLPWLVGSNWGAARVRGIQEDVLRERWGEVVIWHTFCHASGTFQLSVATTSAVCGWWRVCPCRPLIHIHSCAQWHVSCWHYQQSSRASCFFTARSIAQMYISADLNVIRITS